MLDTTLQQLFEPAVTALGYELVGVERLSFGRRGALLRVYIDSPTGVTVDDCGRVSHQISGILDVEEPIKSDYTLEVSSPGLDRPLFALEHYVRFVGKEVSLRLHRPIGTRRGFTGVIARVEGENIILIVDGNEQTFPYDSIEKARIVPEF
ncbi:MAG: ribosome maturation factor RimP [Pseudomonadota bacterium]